MITKHSCWSLSYIFWHDNYVPMHGQKLPNACKEIGSFIKLDDEMHKILYRVHTKMCMHNFIF